METGIKSSFIPSDARSPSAARFSQRSGFADLLILLSIVVLVASTTLAIGVFLYKQYLQQSAVNKVAALTRAKDALQPDTLREITRISDRMKAADGILSGHVAPSALFDIFEQLTLQTIAFSDLQFEATTGGGAVGLSLSGVAQSVNSIALQAQLLSDSSTIKNPVFSDIERQEDGVHFSLEADVEPLVLRYKRIIEETTPALVPTTQSDTNVLLGDEPKAPVATSTP